MGLKPAWEQRVIRLTREQDDGLRVLAQARGRSIAELIREAVERYLTAELEADIKRQEEGRR